MLKRKGMASTLIFERNPVPYLTDANNTPKYPEKYSEQLRIKNGKHLAKTG